MSGMKHTLTYFCLLAALGSEGCLTDGSSEPAAPTDDAAAVTQADASGAGSITVKDAGDGAAIPCQYTCVPHGDLAPGDPVKGRDYLLNGNYLSCGIPARIMDQVTGWLIDGPKISGRTGTNATLPYNYSAGVNSNGVEVAFTNCLNCHASPLDG